LFTDSFRCVWTDPCWLSWALLMIKKYKNQTLGPRSETLQMGLEPFTAFPKVMTLKPGIRWSARCFIKRRTDCPTDWITFQAPLAVGSRAPHDRPHTHGQKSNCLQREPARPLCHEKPTTWVWSIGRHPYHGTLTFLSMHNSRTMYWNPISKVHFFFFSLFLTQLQM
jgi:hypothetical protein